MADQAPVTDNGVSAKKITLGAQIFAAIQIEAVTIYSFFSGKIDFMGFVFGTVMVAAIFAPVYFSVFIDKIKGIK